MSQEVLFVKLGKDSKLSWALLTELNLLKEQNRDITGNTIVSFSTYSTSGMLQTSAVHGVKVRL